MKENTPKTPSTLVFFILSTFFLTKKILLKMELDKILDSLNKLKDVHFVFNNKENSMRNLRKL